MIQCKLIRTIIKKEVDMMIKEISFVNFVYKGKLEIDDITKKQIYKFF